MYLIMINFDQNINTAINIFNSIFDSLQKSKNFLKESRESKNLDQLLKNGEERDKINEAIELLNINASQTESRHKQQQYFADLFKKINNNDFKNDFCTNDDVRIKFLLLYVSFMFNPKHDTSTPGHMMVLNIIQQGLNQILN